MTQSQSYMCTVTSKRSITITYSSCPHRTMHTYPLHGSHILLLNHSTQAPKAWLLGSLRTHMCSPHCPSHIPLLVKPQILKTLAHCTLPSLPGLSGFTSTPGLDSLTLQVPSSCGYSSGSRRSLHSPEPKSVRTDCCLGYADTWEM